MTSRDGAQGDERSGLVIEGSVPTTPTLVQALYHAATGKTENISKRFVRPTIIRRQDLDNLYLKINQQLDLHAKVSPPTVTVKVGLNTHESQQFSSWERFSLFDIGKSELIDDVIIKFEFLLEIPSTPAPQRYVLTIDLDSMLPVIVEKDKNEIDRSFMLVALPSFPACTVSVDFIDYLCAKGFCQIVEDWFNGLDVAENKNWLASIRRFNVPWPTISISLSTVGLALYVAVYGKLAQGGFDFKRGCYLVGIGLTLWALAYTTLAFVSRSVSRKIQGSYIPAVILLTRGDERAFSKINEQSQTAARQLFRFILAVLATLTLNVAASYVYAWLTSGAG